MPFSAPATISFLIVTGVLTALGVFAPLRHVWAAFAAMRQPRSTCRCCRAKRATQDRLCTQCAEHSLQEDE